MNEQDLKTVFLTKVKLLYGNYEEVTSKFGTNSFGKVSSDLCISASQFSKLISGSATEGMYIRSIRNLDQLQAHKELLKEKDALKIEIHKLQNKKVIVTKPKKKILLFVIIFSLIFGTIFGLIFTKNKMTTEVKLFKAEYSNPLNLFFSDYEGRIADVGFLNEDEVQEYCPSSAFEGKWKLKKPYKIPLPGSKKPGVYLLAKSADVIMLSAKYAVPKGKTVIGMEYLVHEVWLDKDRLPLIPKYFDPKKKEFNDNFYNLDFENNSKFLKIAELKSFYLDEITISKDSIKRKGQPCGRYVDFLDKELAKKYEIDIEYIVKEVISDLTKTKCHSSINNYHNPNNLKIGSTISFDCFYSIHIENLGFGGGYPYTKTLELVNKSYSDNLMCRSK
ncbi:hypothetical protein [Aquimarina aquimarini]|uniref:hypothetical protein n=1 Tax=Aquimarina aquimarini TaxID=1191734 RepID=UPI000D55E53F|nr:hypothetical protein [Aquimarina aquimarini]